MYHPDHKGFFPLIQLKIEEGLSEEELAEFSALSTLEEKIKWVYKLPRISSDHGDNMLKNLLKLDYGYVISLVTFKTFIKHALIFLGSNQLRKVSKTGRLATHNFTPVIWSKLKCCILWQCLPPPAIQKISVWPLQIDRLVSRKWSLLNWPWRT